MGVLVPDLEEAIDTYSSRLGITFTDPTEAHVDDYREGDDPSRPIDVRFAYSRQAPNYELIEAHEDGLYGRQHGYGLHHTGMWVPDVATSIEEYAAIGVRVDAAYYKPDGSVLVAYLEPSGHQGVRLELLNEARREGLEAWIRGESAAPSAAS